MAIFFKAISCAVFVTALFSSPQSQSESNRNMQFGLYGFNGKQLTISVNSVTIFEQRVNGNVQFFFHEVDSPMEIDISADDYHQQATIDASKGVKSLKISYGRPISIEAVKYHQGID